jgi:hypothetical protein
VRIALVVALAGVACSRASDESRTKRSPTPPPPSTVTIPAGLSIPLSIDGAAAPPIDAARLAQLAPDFADEDRRAWRLTALVPAFDRPGEAIEADGEPGLSIRLDHPGPASPLVPVLFLTRRGEVVVTLLDPADPFPRYHGQGGRLKRPGDTQPHVSPVTALRVVPRGP